MQIDDGMDVLADFVIMNCSRAEGFSPLTDGSQDPRQQPQPTAKHLSALALVKKHVGLGSGYLAEQLEVVACLPVTEQMEAASSILRSWLR